MSDKTPIEPSDNYGRGFNLGQISCKMREMLIAIGLVVVIVMSLVFVALYSTAASKSGGDSSSGGMTAAQHMGTTPTPDPRTCNTPGCLEGVGYARWLMNVSVDPCEDFYTYACGQWPDRYPLQPDSYRSSVSTNIFKNNQKKLLSILSTDVKRNMPWAAERKAKDLYMSCMDDYGRMAVGGNALISRVLDKIGGWALVHDLPSDWNILDAIEKIHVDFWTDVLFNVYVGSDYTFGYRYRIPIITISSGGLGMGYYSYYLRSYHNKTRADYQSYMRNVAKLLVRDGGVPPGTDFDLKVNTFVSDVMSFETDLANITLNSRYAYSSSGRMSLADVNNQTQNIVDWVSFMKYLFNKATITENTMVNVRRRDYLDKIAQMINNLPADSRNRKVNNYFVWQIAVKYAKDLSYEYIHARKQYYKDRYGAREFQSPDDYCFNYVKNNMPDALSHIFVADHFADKNKEKVKEIASYVKQAIIDGVDEMNFMDKETKAYAKKKLSYTYDNIGYPDWLMDSDAVDLIYYPLNITKGDYFQNVLNVNLFDKVDLNNRYLQIGGENHLSWHGNTYNSYMYLYQTWNELIAPAGLLQSPLYDYHSPHYTNFGAIGSMFGNRYLDAIDQTGSLYGYHGERLRDPVNRYRSRRWWSNSTRYSFTNATSCFASFYVNKTAGSYVDDDGNVVEVPVSTYSAGSYSRTAAQEVGGVKRAYNAYQTWQKKNSQEKLPPVLDLSKEQMFFIAYAQTKCVVTRRYTVSPYFSRYFPIPDSMKVNGAMAMMKEFSKAFGCPADSVMNPSDKCSVF